ncbi:hypothetical protein BBP40_005600 [Aspergillus hancockii]|nr:hypothetical protein BBP40_005600 [Aspergillus hancockii]
MKVARWAILFGIDTISAFSHGVQQTEFQTYCQGFAPEKAIDNAHREFTQYVPAETKLGLPWNDASCARPSQNVSVDLCRVALFVETSSRSGVSMELWLPLNWTGRLLGTGNGGLDGCIKYEDLAYGVANGFAVVGSNNGHNGTTGAAFHKNADTLTDFSWRALHLSVVIGKQLTTLFYGRSHTKAYYIGCSFGGRQGIQSAAEFPGDFDGIVAGSPALDFNNLVSWRASFFPITGSVNSSGFITPSVWKSVIHPEVLNQCDDLDGLADGIIEDPTLCNFRPDVLQCTTSHRTSDCLTSAQVAVVRKVFSPLYGAEGRLIFPAMQPGSEVEAAGQLYSGTPFPYSRDWFQYVVYDPSWDPSSFTVHDAKVADTLNPENIRTWPTDLSAYKARGGKIITYHGQQDGKITSFNTDRFYDHLSEAMHMSPSRLHEFIRFFRISGMSHCNSGPGAWAIGQGGRPAAAATPFTKDDNILAALIAWVELGTSPATVKGTKYIDDNPELGIEFQRNHCRYPLRNTYVGGNPALLENWRCVHYE